MARILVTILVLMCSPAGLAFARALSDAEGPALSQAEGQATAEEQFALAGYLQAQFALAEIYANGAPGVPKDLARAPLWYGKAAEQGHPAAQANIRIIEAQRANPPR